MRLTWVDQLVALVLIIGATLVIGALLALLFQFLWFVTLVPLFGAPVLEFWQAWALLALVGMIGRALRGSSKR